MKKKELADLAVRLFHNIDQAEQFEITRLFYHCDNEFLIDIIAELSESVKDNVSERHKRFSERGENVCASEKELKEIFALVEQALRGRR